MCKAEYCNMLPKYRHNGYCNSCYRYFVTNKMQQYTPSEYGKLSFTPDGIPICHICGQAHSKLGSHVLNKHGISSKRYREYYGLNNNTKLTSVKYQKKMQKHNEKNWNKVVVQNLINNGTATRFNLGSKARLGKGKKKVIKYTTY